VAIFVAVYTDHPYRATGFAAGTIGCAIASLRLQGHHRQPLQ
jgi:hypothetical protein